MSHDIRRNVNDSPVKRPRLDIHEGSSRARRKNVFAHRSLMQRFIPFAEEEQRRERRSSSRASLPLMPTPPTTPIPVMHPTTVVPVRKDLRLIQELNLAQVLDPEDELDLSSDEDDMLTAEEGSDSSNSDSWSSATDIVDLSRKPAQMPAPTSSPQLVEEEPMDISQEDCVVVEPEPMRLGSFHGIVPKTENVETVLKQHDGYSDSSDEEIARVFDDGSDNESLYSWSSSSSNGRVNRPGRHADSVLDNRPFSNDNMVSYVRSQALIPASMTYALPQPHVPIPPAYAQPQPQVPGPLPYVHGHPQLPQVHPQLGMLPSPYIHPQIQTELNGNGAPLDLAIQSKYNLHKALSTPSSGINSQETHPRRKIRRPFEAPYHLGDIAISQMEYQRQQSRSRISRRLASRFTSSECMEQDLHRAGTANANESSHYTQKPCCCRCHSAPKIVPVPVNSFAIDRFLQEARVSAGHATSYLLIPTQSRDLQARAD